jgi:hypothetical protein
LISAQNTNRTGPPSHPCRQARPSPGAACVTAGSFARPATTIRRPGARRAPMLSAWILTPVRQTVRPMRRPGSFCQRSRAGAQRVNSIYAIFAPLRVVGSSRHPAGRARWPRLMTLTGACIHAIAALSLSVIEEYS